jgi:hypothetical protein
MTSDGGFAVLVRGSQGFAVRRSRFAEVKPANREPNGETPAKPTGETSKTEEQETAATLRFGRKMLGI